MSKFELHISGSYFDSFDEYEDAEMEGMRLMLPFEVKPTKKNKMKIIEKIQDKIRIHKDPINKKNRRQGQLFTAISGACATILTSGLVHNPIAITSITVVGGITGVLAGHRALKTF